MSLTHKKVFVTVGTTEFDQLIKHVDTAQFRQSLVKLGYTHLLMQIGRGNHIPTGLSDKGLDGLLQVQAYTFKSTLQEDMKSADLVISHAGAGSCLEVLKLRTAALLVVVNDELMHNHQSELAERLAEDGHALCAVGPKGLQELLDVPVKEFNSKLSALKPYQMGQPAKFKHFLDNVMFGNHVNCKAGVSSVVFSAFVYISLAVLFLALYLYDN